MAFNTAKNYYEILDIKPDAETIEIKSAFRTLARKYHPDINKNSNAVDLFKEITIAYETLSDPVKRERYDIIHGIFKTPEPDVTKTKSTPKEEKNEKVKTKHNINFLKIFRYWFAKIKKIKRYSDIHKPQKGEDITTEVTITPDEAFTGSKRIINLRTTKVCPQCLGHKFVNGNKCPKCSGKGSVIETKKITVSIPKGIKDGGKLRLRNEGATGKNGGSNGDLYIKIKVEAKTQIHYDKLNIYYNVPITPFEAALGEEITIPAFDGKIKLKLPQNTCSGQKFRIAKQGVKKHGKVGDLIITVSIEFSHDLSEDEIKLYRELKNLSHDDVRKNFGYGY
ncbi:DnaJ domain-containing protein [bacterium]|nr:DnaJ domain-containing protein [bacterium]